ncbi:MAG: sulfatase [Myxococcota bacterium]
MATTAHDERGLLRSGYASALGWVGAGLVNFTAGLWLRPHAPPGVRLSSQSIDLGRHAAAGLVCVLLVWLWVRFGPRRRWGAWLAFFAATAALGFWLLWEDAAGFAGRTAESTGLPFAVLHPAGILGASFAVVAVWWGSRRAVKLPFGWVAGTVVALAAYTLNVRLWQQDNPGIHFFFSMVAAFALGPILARHVPALEERWRSLVAERGVWAGRALLSIWAIWGVASVALQPTNNIKMDVKAWSPNLLALSMGGGAPKNVAPPDLAVEERSFYVDRTDAPSIPPTKPPIIDNKAPIVILLTVDTFRYDVLGDPKNAESIPTIKALADTGLSFTQARTPGAQTVYTMSAFSSGKYFSQLYWTKYKRSLWLHDDESVHFPQLLTDAGVNTIFVPGAKWFADEYGIFKGFSKGKYRKSKHKWSHGKSLTKRLNAALKREINNGPMFIYCHYLDPHVPYTRGKMGKEGDAFQRYLSEVELVDTLIASVVKQVKKLGVWDRTILIVSGDHGEAFGEHGVEFHHSVNLYDEMIRVPLVITGRGVKHRELDQLVSFIDLGPTILDIFGVPTPGSYMGQSLVPLMAGEDKELRRPIATEGRKKRMMVFPTGIKIIIDQRADTVEVYDLKADPKELKNLSDTIDLGELNEYRMMQKFWDVHQLKRGDYEPPYRK